MAVKAFLVLGFLFVTFLHLSLEVAARELAESTKDEQTKDAIEDAKYKTNAYTIHVGGYDKYADEAPNTIAEDTKKEVGVNEPPHPCHSCILGCCKIKNEDPNIGTTEAMPEN